jgi:peptide-methionine (S)-S-oxide reductase
MTSSNLRSKIPGAVLALAALALLVTVVPGFARETAVVLPAAQSDLPKAAGPEQSIVLAGGCFWGVQGVFQRVKGVHQAVSGYAGGPAAQADYETVSSGRTGHAESVKVTYDPAQVSLGELLQVYFSVVHDPTQLNRQGPDSGTQYRSAIFVADDAQRRIAQDYIAQLGTAKAFRAPIVTRIEPLKGFYPAEAYHQDYLTLHPEQPYIAYNDLPKVENLKRTFPALYRAQPSLVNSSAAARR